jgi:hypothetical protein
MNRLSGAVGRRTIAAGASVRFVVIVGVLGAVPGPTTLGAGWVQLGSRWPPLRLRARVLGGKRSLAIREFALGIEALDRFVRGEPLRRVHECVFLAV